MKRILIVMGLMGLAVTTIQAGWQPKSILISSITATYLTKSSATATYLPLVGGTITERLNIVNVLDDATKLSLSFGDGDTGFIERSDDVLLMVFSGNKRFRFDNDQIDSDLAGAFDLFRFNATDTVPIYRFNGDTNTGIGSAGDDQLSMIAGSTEGIRVTTTAVDMKLALTLYSRTEAELKAITPTAEGQVYYDSTNKAAVISTGTAVASFGLIYNGNTLPTGW